MKLSQYIPRRGGEDLLRVVEKLVRDLKQILNQGFSLRDQVSEEIPVTVALGQTVALRPQGAKGIPLKVECLRAAPANSEDYQSGLRVVWRWRSSGVLEVQLPDATEDLEALFLVWRT